LAFQIWFTGSQAPLEFDFYAYTGSITNLDFSAHAAFDPNNIPKWTITMPASQLPEGGLDDVIPEPASVVVWSLLGLSGVGLCMWRKRK